jgi:hypothetical protein
MLNHTHLVDTTILFHNVTKSNPKFAKMYIGGAENRVEIGFTVNDH